MTEHEVQALEQNRMKRTCCKWFDGDGALDAIIASSRHEVAVTR